MNWKQRARIKLQVDQKHLEGWTSDKFQLLCTDTLGRFGTNSDVCMLGIQVQEPQRKFVEFTAALTIDSPSALAVAQSLEHAFLGLKIYSREVIVEKK